MIKYKLIHAKPLIIWATVPYLAVGLVFGKWHTELWAGVCLGGFFMSSPWHPNLVDSLFKIYGAFQVLLSVVGQRIRGNDEYVKNDLVPPVPTPPTESERKAYDDCREIYCRHLALIQKSEGHTDPVMHKDHLLAEDMV